MKVLNKFYRWFLRNVQILNTLLLIILISQLISYFNIKLINNTIIPISYLVSIGLLFLTFRESQKGNKIELGKDIFEKHLSKIQSVKEEINNVNLFGDKIFSQNVFGWNFSIKNFPIVNLLVGLAIDNINSDKDYKPFISRLNQKDESLLILNDEKFSELNDRYKSIYKLLLRLNELVSEFVRVYQDIYKDRSFMSEEQTHLLSREIDDFLEGYYFLSKEIIDNHNLSKIYFINSRSEEIVRLLENFENKKFFSKLYSENFTEVYSQINMIKKSTL